MKHARMSIACLAMLLAVSLCASLAVAVVVEEDGNQEEERVLPRPQVRGGPGGREPFDMNQMPQVDDPRVEKPKADKPAKEEPKVRVDPRTTMINNALTAIAAAEKAVAADNKEVATAELAKAKAAIEALQKSMLRDKLRENMEYRSMGDENKAPAEDAKPQKQRTRQNTDAAPQK